MIVRLLAGLLACALASAGLDAVRGPMAGEGASGLRLEREGAVETAFLFGIGMRRLAADLGLVRLLLYYGTPEEEAGRQGRRHEDEYDPAHPERSFGGGRYPLLGPKAKAILDLDPAFSYPALFAAGALAFNLDRMDEAAGLIGYGLRRDPRNARYQQYLAAIGCHRRGKPEEVVRIFESVVRDPDCPTMVKNMLARLYEKAGRRAKALELYRGILETTRDPGYRRIAERAVRRLGG